jgi:predicted ArsR family transcriptional regulator
MSPRAESRETYGSTMVLRDPEPDIPSWTFLTNHAHVLIAISRDGELRQRDIAHAVGITTGAVQRIIDDLEEGGYVRRERVGRRNHYVVTADRPLRHPLERPHSVQELLSTLDA